MILLAALLLAACAPAPVLPSPALRQIRLPMGFIPSVQYACFYVAVDKGYFADEGLEIEFDYSFETDGVQLVGANQLPLAVVSGEQVLLARAQGLPVVYVMAWFQKFPLAIVAPEASGIRTPADLKGKRIGVPALEGASFIGLRALMAQTGLTPDDVTLEVVGFQQVAALTAGQVDAVVVYTNNEPIRLAAQGEKLSVIQVSDYAALAANGLLSNETVIAAEPELVRGFVRALARGIQEALANPDEAYAITKTFVPELTDDAVEKAVLLATLDLWRTDVIGRADPQAWENMQAALLGTQLLAQPLDLSQAFTNQFVP
jgi:NitT/TauT family transport system substrate-binding protein